MSTKLTAVGENILIKKIDEATSSWIILWTDADAPTRGEILDIWQGVYEGEKRYTLSIGDIVYFSKHATESIYIDGEKLYLVKVFSILAKE